MKAFACSVLAIGALSSPRRQCPDAARRRPHRRSRANHADASARRGAPPRYRKLSDETLRDLDPLRPLPSAVRKSPPSPRMVSFVPPESAKRQSKSARGEQKQAVAVVVKSIAEATGEFRPSDVMPLSAKADANSGACPGRRPARRVSKGITARLRSRRRLLHADARHQRPAHEPRRTGTKACSFASTGR